MLDGSISGQYEALQLNNGTLQTVGSRLMDTKATYIAHLYSRMDATHPISL